MLLVADDLETMETLEQTFARAGLRVFLASNFEQVLAGIQEQMPDIIVCDSEIKNVTRHSLQQKLPDCLELETVPIIFLCSAASAEQTGRYLDLDQYCSKPFDPIMLATMAERTLAYRGSLVHSDTDDEQLPWTTPKVLRKEVLRELQRVQRYGGNMSLCLLEIVGQPGAKTQGSNAGPVLFNKIAEFLPGMIRKVDLLARITRRRFLWILPETDNQGAEIATQRLMISFAKIPVVRMNPSLDMHAGLAMAPDDGLSYEELLELAHLLLSERPIKLKQQAEV